jgi:DNA-binding response OmpR family regulator
MDKMTRQVRIFLLEDDPGLSKVLAFHLGQLGCKVCGTLAYGEGAFEKIQETKPDIVLIDIKLAGRMDGIDVGELLANRTDIPFIYLTSLTDKQTLLRAGDTVPEGYLKKPYDIEQLRITIEMALNR